MKIIIANTNIQALLQTTDSILKQYNKEVGIPEKIKSQATLSVLKTLMENNYFDVCKVNDMAKLNGVHIPEEESRLYHSMHCIHFSNMHQDTREYLMASLVNVFRSNLVMAHSNG